MKKLITTVAFVLCCSAAFAQTNPIIVQGPDGKITQCINLGNGIIRCY